LDQPADAGELAGFITSYLAATEGKLAEAAAERIAMAARADERRKWRRIRFALVVTIGLLAAACIALALALAHGC
jgi:hypothetical protein